MLYKQEYGVLPTLVSSIDAVQTIRKILSIVSVNNGHYINKTNQYAYFISVCDNMFV